MDWMAWSSEIIVALLGAVGVVTVAIITTRTRRVVDEIHASTVNSHGTDLRQDVDALMDMVRDNTVALQRILGSLADANATMAQLAREQERQRAEHKATHRRLLRHVTESKGWLRVVRRHHPDVPPWPTTSEDEGDH